VSARASPPAGSEFARGWSVLLAAMIGVACGASPLPFNSIGFFLAPLHAEFGWSFFDISFGITIYGVIAALLAPVYGSLADRYGVRPVALISLAAFGVAFACFAFTPPALAGYYALWILVGLVGIGSTPVTWSRAVNLWFFRNRGLALGILLVGTSLAALTVPRLSVWFIGDYGWRNAFLLLALLPLVVALPLASLLFREPKPEERPIGLSSGAGGALLGLKLRDALSGYRFWLIFVSILCVAFAYGGAHLHMAEILGLQGFSRAQAATIVAYLGMAILCGRIFTGFLLDRLWAPLVTLPLLSLPAISCWLLAADGLTWPLAVFAAILLGLAAGAESDLIAFLAGRYFGMAHYGKIYGMLYMPFGLASAVSPAVYGAVRDASGDYDAILIVAMALFVIGALLLLGLGRYPDLRVAHSSDR
jgi:OFA family oxalate/formate antiporter-like MFS transporter